MGACRRRLPLGIDRSCRQTRLAQLPLETGSFRHLASEADDEDAHARRTGIFINSLILFVCAWTFTNRKVFLNVCNFASFQLSSPWSSDVELLPASPDYVIVDHVSAELAQLQSNERRATFFKEMRTLFQLIEANFDESFRAVTSASIQNGDGVVLRSVDSTFGMCLKLMPWLPAVRRMYSTSPPHQPQDFPCVLPAGQVYVRSPVVEELLAHRVPSLACPLSASSSFAEFMKLKRNVTVEAVKEMLVEYSKSSAEEMASNAQHEVIASRSHIKRVYKFLSDHLSPKDLQELFESHPVIFHSRATSTESRFHDVTRGVFLCRDQTWWKDPSGLFGKYRKQLLGPETRELFRSELWFEYREHDLLDMFVRVGRVPIGPDFNSFAKLLVEIARSTAFSPQTHEDILKVT